MKTATLSSTVAYRAFLQDDASPDPSPKYVVRQSPSLVVNRAPSLAQIETWQADAIKAIAALGQLPHNWDGYGSRPPSEAAKMWAVDLILRTSLGPLGQPQIGPESDGGLQLNWWSGHRRQLELHVETSGITYVRLEGGQVIDENTFARTDTEEAERLLTWLKRG